MGRFWSAQPLIPPCGWTETEVAEAGPQVLTRSIVVKRAPMTYNGAAVAEATADAATDAKGGGIEVIDVDDGTRTRMRRRLWTTSMPGTMTGTTAASACQPPIGAQLAARPRLLLTLEGSQRRRVAAVDFPPPDPLSRSWERRG